MGEEAPARAGLTGASETRGYDGATSPAMRLLDRYLRAAVDAGASDLHMEPEADRLIVRMRVDGGLRALESPPVAFADAMLTRARLMAGVDLSERRQPQDGRFVFEHAGGHVDIRAAFVPVYGGERVALRLLHNDAAALRLADLGLEPTDRDLILRALDRPRGLIVVVGPTGSGKTTTLYAALEHLRRPNLSIITVEDPVERNLAGVAQVTVDDECGRSFSAVLRALLRQDPDVVMIGEMRDSESATIACRAALTGHRVLTTLHTADTREALVRLNDMGVADYLVAATLSLVVAQRLVRRICTQCERGATVKPAEAALYTSLGLPVPEHLHEPCGCVHCHGEGFRGRVAVFEVLACTSGDSPKRPRHYLLQEGLRMAATGRTSLAEVVAVCPEPGR